MIHEIFAAIRRKAGRWIGGAEAHEHTRELLGALLSRQVTDKRDISSLHEVEFRVHSQFGDDGIIQWLVARLPRLPKTFVEFGVEDYTEANTRFLMLNNGWRGLVMDGSPTNIARLRSRIWFWRHDLTALPCFITRENVDSLIVEWAVGRPVGLLHIDVDGNDYWLWEAITSVSPCIVIMEYNANMGSDRAITIPYEPNFARFSAHYSGQYAGASLAALAHLGQVKGYALLGTNSAGNNAYFVRRELLGNGLREISVDRAYTPPLFRESRDPRGRLDYQDSAGRTAAIRGMPVFNVVSGQIEPF